MTLDLLPRKLVSLEPVKAALKTALATDLPTALTYVATLYPTPAVALGTPKAIRLVTVNDYTEVTEWPTVTIESGGINRRTPDQQSGTGESRGTIRILCWLQASNPDDLDYLLDRWGAAVCLVLKNRDSFGGAAMTDGLPDVNPDPTGGSMNRRYVEVLFDVGLWV